MKYIYIYIQYCHRYRFVEKKTTNVPLKRNMEHCGTRGNGVVISLWSCWITVFGENSMVIIQIAKNHHFSFFNHHEITIFMIKSPLNHNCSMIKSLSRWHLSTPLAAWCPCPEAATDGASSSCSRCGARVSEEAVAELPIDDEVRILSIGGLLGAYMN